MNLNVLTMKKIMILSAVAVMLVAVSACGNKKAQQAAPAVPAAEEAIFNAEEAIDMAIDSLEAADQEIAEEIMPEG